MITIVSLHRSLERSTHDLISRRRLDVTLADSVREVIPVISHENGAVVTSADDTRTLEALLEQMAAETDYDCIILFGSPPDDDLADTWNACEADPREA